MSASGHPTSGPTAASRARHDLDAPEVRWALDLARLVTSPVFAGMAFCVTLGLAGAVLLVVAGLGINDQFFVSLQVPYVVSGGVASFGLLTTGLFLASVLGDRRDRAEADRDLGEVVESLRDVSRLVVARREARS